MMFREKLWGGFWSASPSQITQLCEALEDLRVAALESQPEPPEIEPKDLFAAADVVPAGAAVGVDGRRPRDFLGLGRGAADALIGLSNGCEAGMMWPAQCLLGIICLPPKSRTDERPV
eukprot:3909222-Pyramimonas_sp.AAC.1